MYINNKLFIIHITMYYTYYKNIFFKVKIFIYILYNKLHTNKIISKKNSIF